MLQPLLNPWEITKLCANRPAKLFANPGEAVEYPPEDKVVQDGGNPLHGNLLAERLEPCPENFSYRN